MKTTFDLPEPLIRQTKILAAQEGTSMREIVTRALQAELSRSQSGKEPAWKKHVGTLEHLGQSKIINAAVESAFGQIDDEMWS